jgi:hypothetical protein
MTDRQRPNRVSAEEAPSMNDLRAELLGTPPEAVPQFALMLPSGWSEFDAGAASERALMQQATRRLRDQHRPDLLAQLRALTGRAFSGMRSASTLRIYLQTEAWDDGLILPLSITASVRTAPDGGPLDHHVAELIRTKAAKALHEDKRFVRWESSSELAVGSTKVGQHTVAYLTPFPKGGRTHALQFTAVAVHPLGAEYSRENPLLTSMFELSDSIVSTFVWHRG